METDRIAPSNSPPSPPSPTSIEVEVSDTQSHLVVDTRFLTSLVRRALQAEGVEAASISIALVDDPTIRAINRRHLDHDWPTDVISFVLSEPSEPTLCGELVISAEMAASTARESGGDPLAELALYAVHGLLHLLGFDDGTAEGSSEMRRRESEILDLEGVPNPFPLVGPGRAALEGPEMMRWPR